MSYLLILVLSSSNSITTNTVSFSTEERCLKAIEASLDLEKNSKVKVRAMCVKQ